MTEHGAFPPLSASFHLSQTLARLLEDRGSERGTERQGEDGTQIAQKEIGHGLPVQFHHVDLHRPGLSSSTQNVLGWVQ